MSKVKNFKVGQVVVIKNLSGIDCRCVARDTGVVTKLCFGDSFDVRVNINGHENVFFLNHEVKYYKKSTPAPVTQKLLDNLKVGDVVITVGGIKAFVTEVGNTKGAYPFSTDYGCKIGAYWYNSKGESCINIEKDNIAFVMKNKKIYITDDTNVSGELK
jgi:hypothetical protein